MSAANYDITIDRASYFRVSLTIYDGSAAAILPEATTFYADIREKITKKEITEFIISFVTDGSDGKIFIDLPEEQTKLLTQNSSYEYDLFMVLSGRTYRLLEGDVTVRNNRTNDV